jgi:glycosyltransferase involved in cell wall biosynthesis
MGKQLVNFITCGCESSAPFFVIYKDGWEHTLYFFFFFFIFVSSIVRNLHSYKSPYITTWHGCTRIYNIITLGTALRALKKLQNYFRKWNLTSIFFFFTSDFKIKLYTCTRLFDELVINERDSWFEWLNSHSS